MKVIVDSMLGDIVVWLRLGGIDTTYIDSKESDIEILRSLNRNTLLVSGDKELIKCAKRKNFQALLITQGNTAEKVALILAMIGIREYEVGENSRCVYCNSKLIRIKDKKHFEDFVRYYKIENVKYFEKNAPYFFCERCRKFYWKGRMWKNIEKMIKAINGELRRISKKRSTI